MKSDLKLYWRLLQRLLIVTLAIGGILRILLLFNEQTQATFSFSELLSVFVVGGINDVFISFYGMAFIVLNQVSICNVKYKSPYGYLFFGVWVSAWVYVTFFHTVFDEYGSVVPLIVSGVLEYKCLSYGVRLFFPRMRVAWSYLVYVFTLFLYVFLLILNAIGEYTFWNEFGVRYNFIAVDYLIYTHEVIGNIMESYPMFPIVSALLAGSAIITYFVVRAMGGVDWFCVKMKSRLVYVALYAAVLLCGIGVFSVTEECGSEENVYVEELSSNGVYSFYNAYKSSSLKYEQFYDTLSEADVKRRINEEYGSIGVQNIRYVGDSLPEVHKNIVLITVESLSASFLSYFGGKNLLTPNMDTLILKSMVFENLYATGNRSVRGLEAVTLCLPPSPGESIIKRERNANLFTVGSVLRGKGYVTQYLYGGDSYFDNMRTFYEGNGYEVIDQSAISDENITFRNIWGVCDEDLYGQAIRVFGENERREKPFFAHIMTVSNHRPFTYPDGRIDIPASDQSRSGGVKYTDYALGRFMEESSKQSWFGNTIFVITADHCASSAGRTEIPVEKYHIPAIVYAPGYVEPQIVSTLASQTDIMPTVFGLLHFSYESRFFGCDVMDQSYVPRAFMATYQDLGYWQGSLMTVLSPVCEVKQYMVSRDGKRYNQQLTDDINEGAKDQAIANYQSLRYQL